MRAAGTLMKLGLHTYSLNLHGIGQDWAGLKWPRQISTFELMDMILDLARPRPVSGSRFHPRVIALMSTFAQKIMETPLETRPLLAQHLT